MWAITNEPCRFDSAMTLDRTFYFFMALVGILAGVVLARSPQAAELALRPYFWILIAVALFDLWSYLRGAAATGGMLSLNQRILGFAIGLIWMVLVP
jgi:uncharacterized membrane protein HdeD (DUF308 family)